MIGLDENAEVSDFQKDKRGNPAVGQRHLNLLPISQPKWRMTGRRLLGNLHKLMGGQLKWFTPLFINI